MNTFVRLLWGIWLLPQPYKKKTMGEVNFGDAMKGYLERSRLKTGLRALQITDVWEQLMGKTVAKYTDKIELVNATLFVTSSVGPLKQELVYQRENIKKRIIVNICHLT